MIKVERAKPLASIGKWALQCFGTCLALLPRSLQLSLSRAVGSSLRFFGFRKKVVFSNFERFLLAYPSKKVELLWTDFERDFYFHFGCLVVEILMGFGTFFKAYQKWVSRWSVVECPESVLERIKEKKPFFVLASHVGNWEITGAALCYGLGFDGLLVTKLLKPQFLHEAFEAGRKTCRVYGTYEPKTLKDIMRFLKSGNVVGIVADQFAGNPVGVRVPFFGVPVGTHTLLATMVKRTEYPVVTVFNQRQANGQFVLKISEPIRWIEHANPHREIALNTANYAKLIEGFIVKNPSHWLWTHKRFKGDLGPLNESEWNEPRVRAGQ